MSASPGPRRATVSGSGPRRAVRACTAAAGLAWVGVALAACTPAATPAVRSAATDFQRAVRASNGRAACALVSDSARTNLEAGGDSCESALVALHLPKGEPRSVAVWGTNAQVRLEDGVLFLAEFRTGWKVTGAGCQPRAGQPYDCDLEG